MKRFWKPVAVLVAAPVLSVLAVLVIGIAGVMLLSLIQGEGGYAMSGQSFGNDLAATMLTVVAPAAAVWPLARWSGRLAPLEVSSPRTGALSTVALVGTATVAVFGVLVNGLQFQGFGGLPAVVVGVLAWAVALAGVAALAVGLWSIGRRASGSAVAWLGGIAAVDVGVTAFLLSNESMAGSPLASLPLWFPAALWTGDFPESWLGHAGDGMALSFQIPDIAVGYGNILVAVTAFVLGYLGPGRRTVPAASPELAEAAG